MGVINQPSGQIKLTNVSLVRLKKGKKKFEIACYQNKVQDYRKGIEEDLDEVLQIHQIFINVSKGLIASKDDLNKSFGSTDPDPIIKEILNRGDIQLSEKERQLMLNKINNEMLSIISTKCINPNSKKRYPPTMIHKALTELKYNVVVNKQAKLQALDAIKLLISKQIIPIARAKMEVKVEIKLKKGDIEMLELIEKLKILITSINMLYTESLWSCTGLIDPVNYRELVNICTGKALLHVLDMSVIDNSK